MTSEPAAAKPTRAEPTAKEGATRGAQRPLRARVLVRLRPEVLDPQGEAVAKALRQLGFDEVRSVRVGKLVELELEPMPAERAAEQLRQMAETLLSNPVVEDYAVEL